MPHPPLADLLEHLPDHLRERARATSGSSTAGDVVLYWMRNAVRVAENPALEVAAALALQLDLPLLIYHGLSQHYRFASDRHHTFMLQAAADVQRQFERLGMSYAFHLATPTDDDKHLVTLANQAAVVVTEDMPVDPPRRFLNALTKQSATPIACVDTACIVPMQLVGKAHTRAFQFRKATKKLYAERLTAAWPEPSLDCRPFGMSQLPFAPIDFVQQPTSELVARCDIDHAVGPVIDTVGGSEAGYARWELFKQKGLRGYASKRNNALVDGVSRMSAHLHYGMVSPFRLAREAADLDHAGSGKYLDELLIWRELAYAFCFYHEDHDQWSALPAWAQDTLEEHACDSRANVYSWETMARGQTGDGLWDAAQRSLLMQGELHNNVRMTWGKAILGWTATPQQALERMIDLNHRYALDGRDPASYGGLLWCLGQFDRPFDPPHPVTGSLRTRPTKIHADRLDVDRYLEKVATPRFAPVPRVAVIGAGISGLMAARTLADHGVDVMVFEKSRNVGGRMSTRHVDGTPTFDHGAQYFTARDRRFQRYVDSWTEQGVVAYWPRDDQAIVVLKRGTATINESSIGRYVGTPAMNAVCQHLAVGMEIEHRVQIETLVREQQKLTLVDTDGNRHVNFDQVVLSLPAAQTAKLLGRSNIVVDVRLLIEQTASVQMNPCLATLVTFDSPLTSDWVGAFVHDSPLSWVARNSTKPGRSRPADEAPLEHVVLHATAEWSLENLKREPAEVAAMMLAAFWEASGLPPQTPISAVPHRWRYAIPTEPTAERCLFDANAGVACCGDWAGGPRVEGAFLSGMAAAGRILGELKSAKPVQKALF